MANFTFFTSERLKNKASNIIELEKHEALTESPEYFTYFDDGEEKKYSGVITKTEDGKYIGTLSFSHTVDLIYNEKVNAVSAKDDYFTYQDLQGNTKTFIGNAVYNEETDTYTGNVKLERLDDEVIKIYPQD